VLQDLLKGRASEVDMINGRVVEGEASGAAYAAPANARCGRDRAADRGRRR